MRPSRCKRYKTYLGLVTFQLYMPGCQSVKDKRRVVRGLVDKLRSRLGLAVSEVGCQDLLQRSVIAAALVGSDPGVVEKAMQTATAIVDGVADAEVTDVTFEWR